jgi:peptidoglycan/xylan/chitin deacetylase (PgdA/CDA1 family)
MIRQMIRQSIKSTVRHILALICYITNYSLARLKGKVVILMYHRVVTESELQQQSIQPGMYVRNDRFEMQMTFLKEYFQIVSFQELLGLWEEKKWDTGKRYCLITFDDGWLDNYQYAYPVLKKNDIPATVFLPTAFIETNEWFWPEKISFILRQLHENDMKKKQVTIINSLRDKYSWLADTLSKDIEDKIDSVIEKCKALPDAEIRKVISDLLSASGLKLPDYRLLLNWTEVQEMSRHGISFGSHSCSHKILTRLSANDVEQELEDSMQTLQARNINHVPVFCYPNGDYTPEIVDRLRPAGYHAAVSTLPGIEDQAPQGIFSLKRIGIHDDVSKTVPLFAYRLSGIKL